MTNAADKAHEIIVAWVDTEHSEFPELEKAIAAAIESAVQAEREQVEQLRVQLAGCGVAAMGGTTDAVRVKHGDYGHSASYEDVLAMRRKYDSERERASKLVEAAKAVQELQPKVGESPLTALRRHKKSHEQIQVIWDGFDAALAAYEVQP